MKEILLNQNNFIIKGTQRSCYQSPLFDNKIIKIDHKNSRSTFNEAKFYKRIYFLKRKKFTSFTNFEGIVLTNLGKGGLFELVRDKQGNIAPTLFDVINRNALNGRYSKQDIETALSNFKGNFLHEAVVARDIRPWNIVVTDRNDYLEMILVDGIGHRYFIPLCDLLPVYARYIIRRNFIKYGFNSIDSLTKRWPNLP